MAGVMIGVDPHKASHTAVAIGRAEEPLGELRVRASAAQAERLLAWAAAWPERTWAVEGAGGLGHLLAQQLLSAGERVLDVQPKLGARVRLLAAGNVNKNDPNDARSVAVAALRSPGVREARPDDHAAVLKVWSKRRRDLASSRTQVPWGPGRTASGLRMGFGHHGHDGRVYSVSCGFHCRDCLAGVRCIEALHGNGQDCRGIRNRERCSLNLPASLRSEGHLFPWSCEHRQCSSRIPVGEWRTRAHEGVQRGHRDSGRVRGGGRYEGHARVACRHEDCHALPSRPFQNFFEHL
jgi:hypothetical protein